LTRTDRLRYLWRMSTNDTFQRLLALDVAKHVEKKGKFSYLSWAYAIAEMRKVAPDAVWEVRRFPLPDHPHILAPYCATPTGYFVEVAVTVGGVTLSQIHPVIDERNTTIASPKADQINKSIMRCLVKAIALHGLGLHIYAGEDLPLGDDDDDKKPPTKAPPALDRMPALKLAKLLMEAKGDEEVSYGAEHIETVVDDSADGKALRIGLDALADEASARVAGVTWEPKGNAKWPAAAKWLRGEVGKAGL
jgi:hypothetical protein